MLARFSLEMTLVSAYVLTVVRIALPYGSPDRLNLHNLPYLGHAGSKKTPDIFSCLLQSDGFHAAVERVQGSPEGLKGAGFCIVTRIMLYRNFPLHAAILFSEPLPSLIMRCVMQHVD